MNVLSAFHTAMYVDDVRPTEVHEQRIPLKSAVRNGRAQTFIEQILKHQEPISRGILDMSRKLRSTVKDIQKKIGRCQGPKEKSTSDELAVKVCYRVPNNENGNFTITTNCCFTNFYT